MTMIIDLEVLFFVHSGSSHHSPREDNTGQKIDLPFLIIDAMNGSVVVVVVVENEVEMWCHVHALVVGIVVVDVLVVFVETMTTMTMKQHGYLQ